MPYIFKIPDKKLYLGRSGYHLPSTSPRYSVVSAKHIDFGLLVIVSEREIEKFMSSKSKIFISELNEEFKKSELIPVEVEINLMIK